MVSELPPLSTDTSKAVVAGMLTSVSSGCSSAVVVDVVVVVVVVVGWTSMGLGWVLGSESCLGVFMAESEQAEIDPCDAVLSGGLCFLVGVCVSTTEQPFDSGVSCAVSMCPESSLSILSGPLWSGASGVLCSGGVGVGVNGAFWGVWSGAVCGVCVSVLECLCIVGCVWMMFPVGLRSCTRVLLHESRCDGEESLDEALLSTWNVNFLT